MAFADDPDSTREALMAATYEALCTHGYAGVTIQRIGEAFPKSTSLIYHHYDSKDELLLDFLAYMLTHFETNVPREDYPDAAARLEALIEYVLPDELDPERERFTAALVELYAQAAHDEAYREHFTRSTAFFRDRIADIIRDGIDEGVFRADADPEGTAATLLATVEGARVQRVTAEELDVGAIRAELQGIIAARLERGER